MENNDIFNYISPYDCDKFSDLSGNELQNLLILLENYYIFLRNTLSLENNITFGIEIEAENVERENLINKLIDGWDLKTDISLVKGAEVVSPILTDKSKTWSDIEKICNIIKKYGTICQKSAGHIHIGTQILGNNEKNWLNFIKLWSTYENIAFRFGYGNFITNRPSLLNYAEPMKKDFWDDENILLEQKANLPKILLRINHKRHQAVNFCNVYTNNCNDIKPKNTIEFRAPNGTLDACIWQNNINLFTNMLLYSKCANFDHNLVNERHEINKLYNKIDSYNEIYLKQAIELADMIFRTNIDKLNFLKQYLKNFQITHEKNYTRCKRITVK